MSIDREIFDKPALNVNQQIELLNKRGLKIIDREKAQQYLTFIGYYRFSAYCLPFQNGDKSELHHHFKQDTTFDKILDLYIFDRKLRILLMDAIERIEVAFKACISNCLCEEDGPHWFMKTKSFQPKFDHNKFIEKIKQDLKCDPKYEKKREVFIRHYYDKYSSSDLPPSWMVFETLSLGTVSFIFKSLYSKVRKKIANRFSLDDSVIESWLHAISYLRNLCAHHSRLWKRTFTIKPKIAKSYKIYFVNNGKDNNDRFYAQAVIVEIFIKVIAQESHWSSKLRQLLDEYPFVEIEQMGFPDNWYTLPLWQTD